MRARLKPALFFALVALLVAALTFSLDRWRHKTHISDPQLLALVPAQNATIFFADLAALRAAGLAKALAGVIPADEHDYGAFVRQTGFDYTRDVDSMAASVGPRELFFAARGRFEWDRLREYAESHGGQCERNVCQAPTSKVGRWASFRRIEDDVIGLAVSGDPQAIRRMQLSEPGDAATPVSSEPAWVQISPAVLKDPAGLPAPLRMFLLSLQGAQSVVVSAGGADSGSNAALMIRLNAAFLNNNAAQATSKQLQLETRMLQLALLRAHDSPSAADLTGVMTAGTFQASRGHVYGTWPVSAELLKNLQ